MRFDADIKPEVTCCPIEQNLSKKIRSLARKQGLSPGTLVNLWLEEQEEPETEEVGNERSRERSLPFQFGVEKPLSVCEPIAKKQMNTSRPGVTMKERRSKE